jgi:2-haloacid dehalogenase
MTTLFRSPSTGQDIRAVVFDTFGTVVDWRSGVAREAAPFLARYKISMDPTAFAEAWRGRYQPAMEEVRSGRRGYTPLDVLHYENLVQVLNQVGCDPKKIPETEIKELNLAWHRLDPWPDSIPGLARLKTRYIIGPLSNGNLALLLNMAKRAGIPWDTILGSDITRAYKPQREAYVGTAEVLGIAPGALMLVAAHNDDLHAARKAGLATGFVARPTEFGPNQTKDIKAEEDWDVIAPNFVTLAGLMNA